MVVGKKRICALVASLTMLVGCTASGGCAGTLSSFYDRNDNHKSARSDSIIYKSNALVENHIVCYNPQNEDAPYFREGTARSSGVLLFDADLSKGYVLTTHHSVHIDADEAMICGEGGVLNQEVSINGIPGTIVKSDEEKDLALVKLSRPEQFYFKGHIDDDKVEPGHKVWMYVLEGRSKNHGFKEGHVGEETEDLGENHIAFNLNTNPGNSGGGLYALKRGEPVLVGIVRAVYPSEQGTSLAIKGGAIREFLKDTPLEDEYVSIHFREVDHDHQYTPKQ